MLARRCPGRSSSRPDRRTRSQEPRPLRRPRGHRPRSGFCTARWRGCSNQPDPTAKLWRSLLASQLCLSARSSATAWPRRSGSWSRSSRTSPRASRARRRRRTDFRRLLESHRSTRLGPAMALVSSHHVWAEGSAAWQVVEGAVVGNRPELEHICRAAPADSGPQRGRGRRGRSSSPQGGTDSLTCGARRDCSSPEGATSPTSDGGQAPA